MYKLFLCLRYLRSRVLAYFAAAAVALCVAMMLIVVSVMDGFLHRIEVAAKGLFGDIIVESNTLSGLGRYDEFISDVKTKVPDVQAASPWIFTYGILRLPHSDWRQTVQVAGVRLPERAAVTDFAKGLFIQKDWPAPSFDPAKDKVVAGLEQYGKDLAALLGQYEKDLAAMRDPSGKYLPGPTAASRIAKLKRDIGLVNQAMDGVAVGRMQLQLEEQTDADAKALQKQVKDADAKGDEAAVKSLQKRLDDLEIQRILPPEQRMILGVGIPGLSSRTADGKTLRYVAPGQRLVMTLLPMGKGSFSNITPTNTPFTIIDDCRTDVSSIDNNTVYVPFERLQKLNDMAADEAGPARCSAIHFKVRGGGLGDEAYLAKVRDDIVKVWKDFDYEHPDANRYGVSIKTWRERQEIIISNIAAQRTLVVIMFGVISSVAVVLVFVLFYTIVVQKTKDIGVLKAIGGSNGGVAQIFLGYGAAVGLVGSVFGVILGVVFVHYINEIHDWVGRTFGLVIWSKEYFLFDKIPNEVQILPATMIVVAAIVAGLVGALLPAAKAAYMQPVEALRYE